MRDLKAFWRQVRQLESAFNESKQDCVYLVTVETDNGVRPGLIKLATPRVAAEAIANGTHQVASQEQVAEYLHQQQEEGARLKREELEKKDLSPSVLTAFAQELARGMKNFRPEKAKE